VGRQKGDGVMNGNQRLRSALTQHMMGEVASVLARFLAADRGWPGALILRSDHPQARILLEGFDADKLRQLDRDQLVTNRPGIATIALSEDNLMILAEALFESADLEAFRTGHTPGHVAVLTLAYDGLAAYSFPPALVNLEASHDRIAE
jgi:hypothetical protein